MSSRYVHPSADAVMTALSRLQQPKREELTGEPRLLSQ